MIDSELEQLATTVREGKATEKQKQQLLEILTSDIDEAVDILSKASKK